MEFIETAMFSRHMVILMHKNLMVTEWPQNSWR